MAAPAENFSHQPLDPVPHHGVAHFTANGDPQSGFSAVIVFADNDKIGGVALLAASRQSQELRSFSQAGRFWKSLRALNRHSWLYVRARLGGTVTVSFLRPLALRRLSTLRPPGVAMRARNPCVLFLRMLLG